MVDFRSKLGIFMQINHLALSPAKAEYLLNYTTGSGVGGDKRKFWHEVMGYESPGVLRKALLAQVTVDLLQPEGRNAFGERYYAIVTLTDSSGASWQIRTCWIVLLGEDTARFVTAFPERARRSV